MQGGAWQRRGTSGGGGMRGLGQVNCKRVLERQSIGEAQASTATHPSIFSDSSASRPMAAAVGPARPGASVLLQTLLVIVTTLCKSGRSIAPAQGKWGLHRQLQVINRSHVPTAKEISVILSIVDQQPG